MSEKVIVKNTSNGIGFCGALTILFIALKLLNVITWSWWWVLSPLWITIIIGIMIIMIIWGGTYLLYKYLP